MIKLKDFCQHIMREAAYGQLAALGNAGDLPTSDILASINKRATRIWARSNWKWSNELLKFALVPNQRQYAVTAASGNPIDRILDLIPYDQTGTFLSGLPLSGRETRDFYVRTSVPQINPGGTTQFNTGFPTDYYIVEMDANGNWQIIVDPVPTTAAWMGGYAKAILYTYLLADVQANNQIQYFPNGIVLEVLYDGVMSDVRSVQNNIPEAARLDALFEAKLKMLVGEQMNNVGDNTPHTTRLPSTVQRLRRRRY